MNTEYTRVFDNDNNPYFLPVRLLTPFDRLMVNMRKASDNELKKLERDLFVQFNVYRTV